MLFSHLNLNIMNLKYVQHNYVYFHTYFYENIVFCGLSQILMAQPFYTDFVYDSYVSCLNVSLKEPTYVNHWFVI